MRTSQIKHVETATFQITMFEKHRGYSVNYTVLGTEYVGSTIQDYALANFIFEKKHNELLGH